ncbi:MAG: hypothetical protein IPM24_06310 [Bryobacterales bacterium]|nr:hypothetical protein [Bryobacterales bacterium]
MRTRLIIFAAIACHGAFAQPIISTIAGMGAPPSGIPATSVSIGSPSRIARDAAGNVYFAAFHCVYKVDPAGILTRVAGTGSPGFGGDGGPAVEARLTSPTAVDIDSHGRLYIADNGNLRVRRVDVSGAIVTIAGNGMEGYGGDGGPATQARMTNMQDLAADSQGNVYVVEDFRLRKVSASGIISTVPNTWAKPTAVAVDAAGNLYFVGPSGNIHLMDRDGSLTFLVETPSSYSPDGDLRDAEDIAVDAAGNVYVANPGKGVIRRITPAGHGSTVVRLPSPRGVAVDPQGNVFVATSNDYRIWKVDATGSATSIAGNGYVSFSGDGGPAVSAQLDSPTDVAVDRSGNVYIADTNNHRIRRIDTLGQITTVAGGGPRDIFSGLGDGGPAVSAKLDRPSGVAVDNAGNIYIADTNNRRIRKVDGDARISSASLAESWMILPMGLTLSSAGEPIFADGFDCTLKKVLPSGLLQWYGLGGSRCDWPVYLDLAIDGQGGVLVGDSSMRVARVSAGSLATTFAGSLDGTATADDGGTATGGRLMMPFGVAIGHSGNVYISEYSNHSVRRVAPDGRITTVVGNRLPGFSGDGGPPVVAELFQPTGLATDEPGNLYVTDTGNGRIRKVTNPATPVAGLTIAIPPFASILVDGAPVDVTRVWTWPVGSPHLLDAPAVQFTDGGVRRYRFSHWSQGGPKTQTIVMPGEQTTYRAHFHEDLKFRVTVSGGGTVTLNPPVPADGFYPRGTVVTVTAVPDPGWRRTEVERIPLWDLARWSTWNETTRTFTVDSALEVRATFVPADPNTNGPLRFVAVTPCRVMDTRPGEGKTGPFGAPALEARELRSVPVPESDCGIPTNAAAFSLNATVVPAGFLGYLTLGTFGGSSPEVSTLNSFDGRVVANAAIVPASNLGGAISVFASHETHVILDINGYFIP